MFFSSSSRDINSTLKNSKKGEDRRLFRQQGYYIYFPFFVLLRTIFGRVHPLVYGCTRVRETSRRSIKAALK